MPSPRTPLVQLSNLRIDRDGRKCRVGTAVFDEDGGLCGRAEGIWILPRETPG